MYGGNLVLAFYDIAVLTIFFLLCLYIDKHVLNEIIDTTNLCVIEKKVMTWTVWIESRHGSLLTRALSSLCSWNALLLWYYSMTCYSPSVVFQWTVKHRWNNALQDIKYASKLNWSRSKSRKGPALTLTFWAKSRRMLVSCCISLYGVNERLTRVFTDYMTNSAYSSLRPGQWTQINCRKHDQKLWKGRLYLCWHPGRPANSRVGDSCSIRYVDWSHFYRTKSFCKDAHLNDVLVFPPKTDLHIHPKYVAGEIILQVRTLSVHKGADL